MPQTQEIKTDEIVRDRVFKQVNYVRVDSQGRIPLGRAQVESANGGVVIYRVYQNSFGQIILDPQVIVPAHEAWLLKNPQALTLVAEGWKAAKEGKVVKAREDYTKHVDAP